MMPNLSESAGLFELLMARIRALEADMANLREELDEVRNEVNELRMQAVGYDYEADGWIGGTDE